MAPADPNDPLFQLTKDIQAGKPSPYLRELSMRFTQSLVLIWDATHEPAHMCEIGQACGMRDDEYIIACAVASTLGMIKKVSEYPNLWVPVLG